MEPTPRIRALLNYCSDTALPRSNPAGPLPSTRRATVPRAALLTSAHPDVPRAKAVGTESLSEMHCDWSSVPLRKTRALHSIAGRGWTSPASKGRWGSNSSNLLREFVPVCSFKFAARICSNLFIRICSKTSSAPADSSTSHIPDPKSTLFLYF